MHRAIPHSLVWLAGLIALAIIAAGTGGTLIYLQTRQAARTHAEAITGGDRRRGRAAIARYACGSCHVVSGVTGARGRAGPDLTDVAERTSLAGTLPNDPAIMIRWLMHPQRHVPGTGMPEQGVTDRDARDMAAYLYAQE